jgi:SWI/SNF-related matrix-associated actin-dependent regulator 1 of chromatin subfamily A
MKAILSGNTIRIDHPDEVPLLMQIKDIPGRQYFQTFWTIPLSYDAIERLQKMDYAIDEDLQKYLQKAKEKKNETYVIEGLKGCPRQFQNEGLTFVEYRDGKALITDEMGLGKSLQALMYVQRHRDKIPVVIVCTASLKLNWQREIEKWLPETNIEIISGIKKYETTGDILIINYDILWYWIYTLQKRNPQILIADECHKVKNDDARRTKAIKRIAKTVPHIIGLSGTPIQNRPDEIFNAIELVYPGLFQSRYIFRQRYCMPSKQGYGWDFKGQSRADELYEKLKIVMIRRLKKDVLTELSDKIYSFVPMVLENEKEYFEAEKDFIAYVRKEKGHEQAEKIRVAEALVKVEGLKQLVVKGKLKQCIDWIKDFLESDEKLVVFCTHRFVVDALMKEFKDAVKVDGSVSTIQRQKAVDDFQNGNAKLFIGNMQAAGDGITLTSASNLVFLELGWSPSTMDQASDRIHRIGQKDSCNIYYLLASGTIEERIAKLLDKKRLIIDAVLDGKETEQESLLFELMNSYK